MHNAFLANAISFRQPASVRWPGGTTTTTSTASRHGFRYVPVLLAVRRYGNFPRSRRLNGRATHAGPIPILFIPKVLS